MEIKNNQIIGFNNYLLEGQHACVDELNNKIGSLHQDNILKSHIKICIR